MTTAPFSTDARFRRAQAQPVRRRRPAALIARFARGLLLAAVTLAGAYGASTLIVRAETLRIDTITVAGNRHLSSGEVAALLAPLHGASIVTADLERHRGRLLASSWIRAATLRRVLPSTIAVTIEERRPVGLARIAARLYLLDDAGTIITEHGPALAGLDLPIVDGLALRDGAAGAVDRARTRLAARLIAALDVRPDLSGRVSQIDVADAHDAVVLLADDPTLLHLGDERFVERLDRYLELAPALRDQARELDYADLRFDRRVYVRPAGSGRSP